MKEIRSPKTGELIRGGIAADGSAYAPVRRRKPKKTKEKPKPTGETKGKTTPLPMASPMKGKLKPCQKAAAKRKFKVYPSAYANMWASNHKC